MIKFDIRREARNIRRRTSAKKVRRAMNRIKLELILQGKAKIDAEVDS